MDRCMVDVASCGALVDKTPAAAQELLAKMAQNAQQFSDKMHGPPTSINEIRTPMDHQRIENKIEELASMVRHLALGKKHQPPPPPSLACGI